MINKHVNSICDIGAVSQGTEIARTVETSLLFSVSVSRGFIFFMQIYILMPTAVEAVR